MLPLQFKANRSKRMWKIELLAYVEWEHMSNTGYDGKIL